MFFIRLLHGIQPLDHGVELKVHQMVSKKKKDFIFLKTNSNI